MIPSIQDARSLFQKFSSWMIFTAALDARAAALRILLWDRPDLRVENEGDPGTQSKRPSP